MSRAAETATTRDLTTPDLVLLSLLSERPMHGYEVNAELERRQVRDWAGISRPQIYYSLEKLVRLRLVRRSRGRRAERRPRAARPGHDRRPASQALARRSKPSSWTTGRDQPPFLTWMALSWRARPGVAERQLERRRLFLAG